MGNESKKILVDQEELNHVRKIVKDKLGDQFIRSYVEYSSKPIRAPFSIFGAGLKLATFDNKADARRAIRGAVDRYMNILFDRLIDDSEASANQPE